MITFDHFAIAATTLVAATDHVANALGVPLQKGGEHDIFHTHNTLLGLEDGLYLEAIAINPNAPKPDRARWFDLDTFNGPPRLTNWICRCDDLDATLAQLGEGFGTPVNLRRGDLSWRMAVPQTGVLPFDNCAPALIQWEGDAHPAQRLTPSACRVEKFEVFHPNAARLSALLASVLNDLRITFHEGPSQLKAHLNTPSGQTTLS